MVGFTLSSVGNMIYRRIISGCHKGMFASAVSFLAACSSTVSMTEHNCSDGNCEKLCNGNKDSVIARKIPKFEYVKGKLTVSQAGGECTETPAYRWHPSENHSTVICLEQHNTSFASHGMSVSFSDRGVTGLSHTSTSLLAPVLTGTGQVLAGVSGLVGDDKRNPASVAQTPTVAGLGSPTPPQTRAWGVPHRRWPLQTQARCRQLL